MAHLLGPGVVRPDGGIDRPAVRGLTLGLPGDDPATTSVKDHARLALMALLDSFVWGGLLEHRARHAQAPFVVWEIPLLVEVGWCIRMDRVVVVDCPEDVQRQRVKARNGWDDATIEAVLERQASRAQRLAVADEVIVSHVPMSDLDQQVDALVQRLMHRYPDAASLI